MQSAKKLLRSYSKHLDVHYRPLRELVGETKVRFQFVESTHQHAGITTKVLLVATFT